ncbi:transmembrane and coiled-coil domain protein 3-like [Denticeps clupeoides]|uniref:Transmembrane and coiled-coil domain family 3 n=2 Tax=Denticeps clupeoides TaxID=299321 RepID=A0AAY4CS28_9TELE|nr:transmembrane and coiled-coil domain protein 3-like [Denticeps clupeoides]
MPGADCADGRSSYEVETYQRGASGTMDPSDRGYVLSIPVPNHCCGSDTNLDLHSTSSVESSSQKSRLNLDVLQQKILKVTEQLKIEQTASDDNVAEFLKLINSADKQQAARIRQVFEKKNQKSAHSIAQLQRKLEQYHRRLKEGESSSNNGSSKHNTSNTSINASPSGTLKEEAAATSPGASAKGLQKDMSGTGRHAALDKIKTIGPGVSLSPPSFFKPREFANLIRNKFGSADNITQLKNSLEEPPNFQQDGNGRRGLSGSATMMDKSKVPSDDECSSGTSASADSNGNLLAATGESPDRLEMLLDELVEIRASQTQLVEVMETLKNHFQGDYEILSHTLQEEKYKYERLEDQLHDLTELHQNELVNLKQELTSIEEKVAYQANERTRDLQEALETCQTRLAKLELQQQQQQVVQREGGTDARVLLGRCINILLALATVILVCVSTAAKFAAPLLRSRMHVLLSTLALLLLAFCWRHWDQLQSLLVRLLLPG